MSDFLRAVLDGVASPSAWPLERILSEPAAEFATALRALREQTVADVDEIYIYGPGQNGQWLAGLFDVLGRRPAGFISDLPSHHGTTIRELRVVPPEALRNTNARTLVVVSMFSPTHALANTRRRLEASRCRVISLPVALDCFFPQALPFYFVDRAEHCVAAKSSLLALSAAMVDPSAAERLWRYVVYLLTLEPRYAPPMESGRFGRPEIAPGAVFVDGGAFNGDTLALFLAAHGEDFQRAVLFEPDRSNFQSLSAYAAGLPAALREKMDLHNCGLWSRSDQLAYRETGTPGAQLSAEGAERIEVRALDALCSAPGPYVVKLDVEGAEEQAIQGMRTLIKRQRPYIEAAVYHKQADLYRLPELIRSFDDRYKFDLRSYGHDGTDTMICALPQ
jgi:FkbM family methyltransferase